MLFFVSSWFLFLLLLRAFVLVVVCTGLLLLGLGEFELDDSEGEINEEEAADEDESNEVDDHENGECLGHHKHNVGPSLDGHALEDLQKGGQDIVEVGDSVIRVGDDLPAGVPGVAGLVPADPLLLDHDPHRLMEAPLLQKARKQLNSPDCEDRLKENQDQQRLHQQRKRIKQRLYQHF